jgi:NAD+ synthase (glutamine-hydrolysing)
MRIALMQLDPVIGDIKNNYHLLKNSLDSLEDNVDLAVFPELFLTGYPPMDLLEKSWFIDNVEFYVEKIEKLSENYSNLGILFGAPTRKNDKLYNSAILIHNGRTVFVQNKTLLPSYDVFDELRYFTSASDTSIFSFKNERLGISICEDIWNVPGFGVDRYNIDPIKKLADKGATLFVNLSASPFYIGKEKERFEVIGNHCKKYKIPFVYVNLVGGNDELIFDGNSLFLNADGDLVNKLEGFKEEIRIIDTNYSKNIEYDFMDDIESAYKALVLGTRDYIHKSGFSKVVIGLSGGIDSAVVASIAVDSLGKENVLGITMPSIYSSDGSVSDSERLARNLQIEFKEIPIKGIFESYLNTLEEHFKGLPQNVAEENLQARIRGNILMAFSNKFGYMVLSTGNKSELAVGYCTLYGDMSGGLGVISDLPKTMVYKIANYINKEQEIIPSEIIKKAPSAELRPNQKDSDSLPDYELLDEILHDYVDLGLSSKEIISKGLDEKTVKWIINTINRNEYKRRQAAPGLKITSKAFGMGRRMMIASNFEV